LELTVLALPAEGRPPEFRGAVGSFKIESDISPTTAAVGDPLTLRMRVSGSGNFDRVDTGMLEHIDQWKTYPPKSSLNPGDPTGFKAEKSFEQPLVALKPGDQTLPQLTFSYFDPAARRYETARSAPLRVLISPALADSTLSAPQSPALAVTPGGPYSDLRPDHAAEQAEVKSLLPPYLQARLLAIPSLLALAFAGGWWGVRRRMDPNDQSRVRDRVKSKAVRQLLAQMDVAARAGDSSSFFNAARSALQQALAARWRLAPDQVTAADMSSRLGRDGELIHRLFGLADEAKYSGHQPGRTDFVRWIRIVRRVLAEKAEKVEKAS